MEKKVNEGNFKIIKIVKEELFEFELIGDPEPRIIYYLRKYWFDNLIALEKGNTIEQPEKIEERFGYQSDKDYDQDDSCRFGGDGIFKKTKSIDRQKFFLIVNDLITENKIWNIYEEIAYMRKKIITKINYCNTIIKNIIINIERKEYDKEYTCCRSNYL